MRDLRTRVPGQSLIEELLRQWDRGTIRVDEVSNGVVIDEEAEGWYRGVLGERRVAALLDQLSEEWAVIHSLPIGERGSDIDHLVIGPSGVFTINTKFSPGRSVWVAATKINVERVPKPHLRNLLTEARRASNYLSEKSGLTVPVTGLLVFVDPSTIIIKEAAGGGEADPPIRVLRDSELLDALAGRREYSDQQLLRIVDAAVRPSTWSATASDGWSLATAETSSGAHLAREFDALELEIGPRLELPRGHLRNETAPPSLARKQSGPVSSPRNQPTTSRSQQSRYRRKASLPRRFLGGIVLPILSALMFYWVIQQALANYLASL